MTNTCSPTELGPLEAIVASVGQDGAARRTLEAIVAFLCQNGAARELRILNGFSQEQLGRSLGLTGPTVCRYEAAQRLPRGKQLTAYALTLAVLHQALKAKASAIDGMAWPELVDLLASLAEALTETGSLR
jgi:DNA-binding XRE family transcriptional regulator